MGSQQESSTLSAASVAAAIGLSCATYHTADRSITYRHSKSPMEVCCNLNFAACLDTRRSTASWVAVMNTGM
jgi:hypothetical protein